MKSLESNRTQSVKQPSPALRDSGNGLGRRDFLKRGLMASAALAASGAEMTASAHSGPAKAPRDPWDGLKVGLTSYTLRKFSLDQAIAMTNEVGVKYISLKDMHLPMKSTKEQRREARKKVEDAGLTLTGCGVVYMNNNEDEIRNAFEYARDAGMPIITCSPLPEVLDVVERYVKEFNQRIAIHNHGPGDKRYPSPLDVLRLVQHRDARMGICMDVGHTVRVGNDPVQVIKKCASRLYDFHIKDVSAADAKGQATEVGRGVIDIVAVLRALLQIKYKGLVALEYEAHGDAPMPGVIESLAYVRGVLAAIG